MAPGTERSTAKVCTSGVGEMTWAEDPEVAARSAEAGDCGAALVAPTLCLQAGTEVLVPERLAAHVQHGFQGCEAAAVAHESAAVDERPVDGAIGH